MLIPEVIVVASSSGPEYVLTLVATAAGTLAAMATAILGYRAQQQTREAVRELETMAPTDAISPLSLSALGDYIYGTLGVVPIGEYASNPTVRADVARALEEIERFVYDTTSVAAGEPDDAAAHDSLAVARSALQRGDDWQALAQLRRSIEIELRALARQHGVSVPPRAGVGRLAQALREARVLSAEVAVPLAEVMQIANQAVHGEDVGPATAAQAFATGVQLLEKIHQSPRQ
jgi:hypothetical protein